MTFKQKYLKYKNKYLKLKSLYGGNLNITKQKYFIITAGPTGSGKSVLINKTLEQLNIQNEPYEKILVDDLVELDDKYKNRVKDIILDVEQQCIYDINELACQKNKYENPDTELLNKFKNAYFTTRQEPGCLHNKENKSCDEINDDKIKNTNNKHIIFEFTGSYIPNWLLNSIWIHSNYKIIFTYSLVHLNKLIERNKSRAFKAIEEFKKDPSKSAPRLPDISISTFQPIVNNIKNTLINLYYNCIQSFDTIKCGEKKIERLFLFDNNNSKLELKFDSNNNNNELFDNIINKSFITTLE
jgi:hypothetical protein